VMDAARLTDLPNHTVTTSVGPALFSIKIED
jgi:hypothetical protein